MHGSDGLSCMMTHATTRKRRATGEAPSTRCSAVGVRSKPVGRRPSGRGGGEFRVSVAAGLPAEGRPRPGRQTDPRSAAPIVRGPKAPAGDVAGSRRRPRRVSHGALDAAAGGRADSRGVRGAVSPGACLEGADRAGLELPEAGAPRRRAGRSGDRPVEAAGLAADKKTPLAGGRISSSSMRAGSCSSPTSAEPGPPAGRLPACATAIATIASRSAVASRSPRTAGAWRCTCGAAHGISAGWTSGRFSSTCCAISGARSPCSGIAGRSIGGAKSARSWPTIRGSRFTTSPRTPPSSIPPSTCGRRPTRNSPTAPRTISATCATAWMRRRAASVARSRFYGPAFTPRTCRGRRDTFHCLRRTQ
jgi:hypothetical protein